MGLWNEVSLGSYGNTEKPESARKIKDTDTYVHATGRGWPNFISLSKLIAAESPYVNDGEVTFIATFRIIT